MWSRQEQQPVQTIVSAGTGGRGGRGWGGSRKPGCPSHYIQPDTPLYTWSTRGSWALGMLPALGHAARASRPTMPHPGKCCPAPAQEPLPLLQDGFWHSKGAASQVHNTVLARVQGGRAETELRQRSASKGGSGVAAEANSHQGLFPFGTWEGLMTVASARDAETATD